MIFRALLRPLIGLRRPLKKKIKVLLQTLQSPYRKVFKGFVFQLRLKDLTGDQLQSYKQNSSAQKHQYKLQRAFERNRQRPAVAVDARPITTPCNAMRAIADAADAAVVAPASQAHAHKLRLIPSADQLQLQDADTFEESLLACALS